MPRLVDAEAVKESIKNWDVGTVFGAYHDGLMDALEAVDETPTYVPNDK